MNFQLYEAIETVAMVELEKLDIRTVTLGVSLLDLLTDDFVEFKKRVADRVYTEASRLVKVAREVEDRYAIPIVNKRISITPISLVFKKNFDLLELAKAIDGAVKEAGVDFIGGFSVLAERGYREVDELVVKNLPLVFAETERVCGSIAAGSTKHGLNMKAVLDSARIMKQSAYLTRDRDSIGAAKFVVFSNAVEDNPFMAGAFLGMNQYDRMLSVGISGPGVVKTAIEVFGKDLKLNELAELIKRLAFKITRAGALIGREVANALGVPFGIVDLSLAPTPAVGDSVAEIIEAMGIERVGYPGTTAALAMLTDAVKKGGVMAVDSVGGLSGAFIPVSEDAGMIDAAIKGDLIVEKLEAMTAVCSVGLDMVVVPGNISDELLAGLIADELMIGVVNAKTTACRIIPAYGKKSGDFVRFGGLLGESVVMSVRGVEKGAGCDFVKRGGFVPAPITSFRN